MCKYSRSVDIISVRRCAVFAITRKQNSAMTDKKISFGFSKVKKPALLSPAAGSVNKKEEVQLIQCLEGQTIKLLGQPQKVDAPLVIPLIANTMTSAALASLRALQNTIEGTADDVVVEQLAVAPAPVIGDRTLEQIAAAEILSDLQERQELDGAASSLVLPVPSADELPLNGAKESTLNDYEEIPIAHFGMAMLRGMGFKEEPKTAAGKGDPTKVDGPMLRPKGMGLGADKMIKAKPLLVAPAKDEVLAIRKNSNVRMLTGKHKDLYGTVSTN